MLELMFSALITVLPDYIIRRHVQGREITLYSAWYELRYGITACVILAVTLLTVIFYFHPTTNVVTSLFRTVTIISDQPGRVEEVYVSNNQAVRAGDPIFRLDTTRQRAAAATAQRRIEEVDAALALAESELAVAQGNIVTARAAVQQAEDELSRRETLAQRNSTVVSEQEIETLRNNVQSRQGALDSALAQQELTQTRISTFLPAQRASAEAALEQAEVEIDKSTVFAGTDGTVTQFVLKPGDIVNPILRPAGILVPEGSGRGRFQAGFGQIAAQVLHVGMLTEVTCPTKPLAVVPMVVTRIQNAISTGQVRPTDQLIDVQDRIRPGTVIVQLEPVFESHADYIPPGSNCIAVAYSNHSAEIDAGEVTGFQALLLRIVDGMGIANAIVIRAQALLLPIRVIVFPG